MHTNITENCKEVISRSSRTFAAYFIANDVKYSDIKKFKISATSASNGKITIGGTISNSVELILEKASIPIGERIGVYGSVKLDSGEYEDIPMGKYKISSATTKNCLTTIIANGPLSTETTLGYFSELAYPATTLQMLNEIAEFIGVPIELEGLEEIYVEKKPEGYTYREIIGYLAAMHGTNAVETRDGTITFKWHEHREEDIFTDKADSPELSNSLFSVDKFQCATENAVIARGEGTTGIAISNPLMTEAAADIVWKKISGFMYRPGTFNIKLGTPCIDSWDSFTYGNEKIIATELEYVYDGGFQNVYKSTGESETAANYKGPLTMAFERYHAELAFVKEALVNTLTVDEADIRYAQIEQLDVIEANVTSMVVGNIDGRYATLEYVTANYVTAGVFDALVGKVGTLEADMLTADSGIIKDLQTEITRTNTLIFGSASGGSIQTEFSNSVIAQLGDAQIKSAMIADLAADKITGLDLNTTKFTVHSEDGKSTWVDNTIQISDGTRVRVQIGKDASDDYSMYVWDKSGNLMFDALGLTEDGISRPIIRNDMVLDDAGINASKLDIDSLFAEINGSSNTIKSTKVYFDSEEQTLDVAFKSMTTSVTTVTATASDALSTANTAKTNAATAQSTANGAQASADKAQTTADAAQTAANNAQADADVNAAKISTLVTTVSSQGTEISAIQGQISSKIWQSDITTAVDAVEIGGRNLLRGTKEFLSPWANNKSSPDTDGFYYVELLNTWGQYAVQPASLVTDTGKYVISFDAKADSEVILEVKDDSSEMNVTLGSVIIKTLDWERYSIAVNITINNHTPRIAFLTRQAITSIYIKKIKLEKGNKATDWTPAPEDVEADITRLSDQYTSLEQTVDSIEATVAKHTTDISKKADNTTVTTLSSQVTELEASLDGFKSSVSSTYATKTALNTTNSNVSAAQAAADAAQADIDGLEVGGRNLILNSTGNFGSNGWNGVDNVETGVNGNNALVFSRSGYTGSSRAFLYRTIKRNIKAGEILTLSGYYYVSSEIALDSSIQIFVRSYHTSSAFANICITTISASVTTDIWIPFAVTTKVTYDSYKIPSVYCAIGKNGKIKVSSLKLEIGNKATDWTPAPEDMATAEELSTLATRVSTAETEIDQNSSAIALRATKTEVATAKSEAISSANSNTATLLENYSTTAEMNAAIEVKANSIESSVSSTYATKTALDTTNTNLANNYTKKTIPDTRNDNQTPSWYMSNYPRQVVTEFKFASVIGLSGETYCVLTTTVPWSDSSGGYPKQLAKVGSKEYWRIGTSATTWGAWSDPYGVASTAQTVATQTAEKFNWIVKSGTSASDFTITDRMATLTAQYINLNGLVTFSGLNSDITSAIYGAVSSVDVMYALGTSTTTAPTSGWSTKAPTWVSGKYMWQKTVTTYADGSTAETAATCISGATGATGATGKGVKSITNYYLASASSSGVTTSTSGWTTSIQTITTSKKYLWNYEVITYTDNTTTTTTPCIIGAYGNTGAAGSKGATGATGNGISSIAEYYAVSSSNSTAPTSSWSTTVPTMTATNKYLWNYEIITYTNGSTETTAKRVIGVYGNTGATGKGVKSIVEQYYLSSSSTTQTGGSWSATCPTWNSGYYIWTRSYITWSDSTTSTTTPVLANGLNTANTNANTASTNASTALSTANTASTNANTALSTANTANTNASSALTLANNSVRKYKYTIDISDTSVHDEDTYYPVVGTAIPKGGYHSLRIEVQLDSGSKPSWSTHASGFTCNLAVRVKAHGWGTASKQMGWVDDNSYNFCDKMPAYFQQMTNSSRPVFFLRGGGKYILYADYSSTWTPYTSTYTVSSQSMSPTTSPSNYSALANSWRLNTAIANWCYNNDVTYINGANIYTGTITAKQISVEDLAALNATIGGWDIGDDGIKKTAQAWIGPTYADVQYCNKIILGLVSATSAEKALYDFDADGAVDVLDIIRMNNLIRGKTSIENFTKYNAVKTNVTVEISPDAEKVIHMYGTNTFGTYVESYLSVARLKVPTVVADGGNFNTVNIGAGDDWITALSVTGSASISGALTAGSVQTTSGADLDTLNTNLTKSITICDGAKICASLSITLATAVTISDIAGNFATLVIIKFTTTAAIPAWTQLLSFNSCSFHDVLNQSTVSDESGDLSLQMRSKGNNTGFWVQNTAAWASGKSIYFQFAC